MQGQRAAGWTWGWAAPGNVFMGDRPGREVDCGHEPVLSGRGCAQTLIRHSLQKQVKVNGRLFLRQEVFLKNGQNNFPELVCYLCDSCLIVSFQKHHGKGYYSSHHGLRQGVCVASESQRQATEFWRACFRADGHAPRPPGNGGARAQTQPAGSAPRTSCASPFCVLFSEGHV